MRSYGCRSQMYRSLKAFMILFWILLNPSNLQSRSLMLLKLLPVLDLQHRTCSSSQCSYQLEWVWSLVDLSSWCGVLQTLFRWCSFMQCLIWILHLNYWQYLNLWNILTSIIQYLNLLEVNQKFLWVS